MGIKSVAIYCGENVNMKSEHAMALSILAKSLAERGVTIVYGETNQGLMGVVANSALDAGGKVVGVVTKDTPDSRRHAGLTTLHEVEDLDARKRMMTNISDACIAAPGGHGTLDEVSREITLRKFWQKNNADTVPNEREIILFDPDTAFLHYEAHVQEMGNIKSDPTFKDSKLYNLVREDVDQVLLKLGVMTEQEYGEKYEACGLYGTILVTKSQVNAYRKPISDEGRQEQCSQAFKIAIAGAASVLVGVAAAFAPVTAPLVAGGILALAYANEHAVNALCRPTHNIPVGIQPT